ncbi:MAG: glycosyltransferase family 39 protein [Chloroflexota bacterium]|nr:glycosyltransferase family 39 protein [Chloroflexota bacterium]MDQ5866215.1 glycosyltransferase family 39 protein [Chloroflexota bacterium]
MALLLKAFNVRLKPGYIGYTAVLLGGLFLLSLGLRVYCLDCHSLWFDEIASIEVAQYGPGFFFTDRFGWMRVQTPLHYLTVWLTMLVADPTVTAVLVRLPSALAGALTPVVVYALGKEMFGRAQGMLAAGLLSVSFIHLSYSQDVRPYTILLLLTALSAYCMLRAERTGSGKWWAAFAAASLTNILISYNVLTLVLPAMGPYLLWVLWKAWRNRDTAPRSWSYAILAVAAVGLASVPVGLDMLSVPRIPPDLSALQPVAFVSSPIELVSWFSLSGITELQMLVQAPMLLFMLAGIYPLVLRSRRAGIALCLLFVVLPNSILVVLGTTNVVYQRYVLFVLPFYLLLVANGMVTMASLPNLLPRASGITVPLKVAALVLAAIVLVLASYSGLHYAAAPTARDGNVVDRPDLRAVSQYLAGRATPQDTIIMDGWDLMISEYFWKGMPPAPTFSITDPLLSNHKVEGSIYWVVSNRFGSIPELTSDPRWAEVTHFYNMRVLREVPSGPDARSSVKAFHDLLSSDGIPTRIEEQVIYTLRGSVQQAGGELGDAVESYRRAGTFFPIGEEYLRTSRGFAERGDLSRAWRDALISKSLQPHDPALHRWLAEMLSQMNQPAESRTELEIAERLTQRQSDASLPRP